MLCIGLKVFRWYLVTPNFLIAIKCTLVPYPAFLSQAYLLYFFDIFVISLSLATLAIIDAADISGIFSSPLIKIPKIKDYNLKYVIKGDEKIPEISAASIIAKVSRDRLISKMSKKFTKYAWDKNAGYGTKLHLIAIKKFGVTKHHRKTFSPIHNILSPN